MKVLAAEQMRALDRRTIDAGIPGLVLMENAGHRVVEFLAERFAPIEAHRVVVVCGKGNNGGDGLVIARQLWTRLRPRSLDVVLLAEFDELSGDAAANRKMLETTGCPVRRDFPPHATLVVDAILGTGLSGPASGVALDGIRAINGRYPDAAVVAVDIPSGLPSDSPHPSGEFVRAVATVTFTAPKVAHALPPNCDAMGELRIGAIGTPLDWMEQDPSLWLSLVEPRQFRHLFAPRPRDGHKGTFGHALIIGGAAGKTGAAAMAGMAALRSGAGRVTVACGESNFTALMPELMTEPLPGNPSGKDVLAVGPGLGITDEAWALAAALFAKAEQPVVVDADGLNVLAGGDWHGGGRVRILTPHPGEMSRLSGKSVPEILSDRVGAARDLATARSVTLVLKGQRTLIAFPDGRVWINPTGSPAMATAGAGDILTGLLAGLIAQFRGEVDLCVAAAVYLHGLAGEIGARALGEMGLTATDLLRYLPDAIRHVSH